jgi:hypothetical protein
MSKPTSPRSRCDRIIAMIDDCLAEAESSVRAIAGHGTPLFQVASTGANRHLSIVRSQP